MIITIDGPAGSGKSTAARDLAERLDFRFLDTGAMYRVVAWSCLRRAVDVRDEQAATRAAQQVEISFDGDRVFANGTDVTADIRTAAVSQSASIVAMNPGVRHEMVRQQRKLARGVNMVCEGRDQGTVAFPEAECKFFLVADPRERARRRQSELAGQDAHLTFEDILQQIQARDQRDATRTVAPLKPAADAIVIDTSHLAPSDVVDRLVQIVDERLHALG